MLTAARMEVAEDGTVVTAEKEAFAVNKSDLVLYRIGLNRFNTLCGEWKCLTVSRVSDTVSRASRVLGAKSWVVARMMALVRPNVLGAGHVPDRL